MLKFVFELIIVCSSCSFVIAIKMKIGMCFSTVWIIMYIFRQQSASMVLVFRHDSDGEYQNGVGADGEMCCLSMITCTISYAASRILLLCASARS